MYLTCCRVATRETDGVVFRRHIFMLTEVDDRPKLHSVKE
jgi:hypothetical protein